MKNVASLSTNNTNSPKTPGGISKSLLTPCRRIGLSRNWRRSGPSPFVSPLSTTSTDSEVEKKDTRKRKGRSSDENTAEATTTNTVDCSNNDDIDRAPISNLCHEKESKTLHNSQEDITPSDISRNRKIKTDIRNTPSRHAEIPWRKKSKILLTAIDSSEEDIALDSKKDTDDKTSETNHRQSVDGSQNNIAFNIENINENCITETTLNEPQTVKNVVTKSTLIVSKPVRSLSKKKKSSHQTNVPETVVKSIDKDDEAIESTPKAQQNDNIMYAIKEKSPNDLKKECVVVIQRKLFKNINKSNSQIIKNEDISKTSDTEEDEPLIKLQKENSLKAGLDKDDDFIEKQNDKPVKSKSTKSPKTKIKSTKIAKIKENTVLKQTQISQNIHNDDDNDDFDNKKTILIRKSYEKVTKPVKAKSTGSITQRDIDNIRNRIEAKKKLLLAQSLTPDTEELRNLIKKWQKGCQDALMELLDLMKNKFPDRERMDYSEMLKTLKIPPSLVGYDSDNDCFVSPDDANIILGEFNNL